MICWPELLTFPLFLQRMQGEHVSQYCSLFLTLLYLFCYLFLPVQVDKWLKRSPQMYTFN